MVLDFLHAVGPSAAHLVCQGIKFCIELDMTDNYLISGIYLGIRHPLATVAPT